MKVRDREGDRKVEIVHQSPNSFPSPVTLHAIGLHCVYSVAKVLEGQLPSEKIIIIRIPLSADNNTIIDGETSSRTVR